MHKDLKARIQGLSENDKKMLLHRLKAAYPTKPRTSDSAGSKKIVAYIQEKVNFDLDHFKNHLKEVLPNYMVPTAYRLVKSIPLLPNGKVDKKAIREIGTEPAKAYPPSSGPKNEQQKNLIAIWEEVLNISPISIHDNFFEIGGDSILSIQIVAKARKQGIKISPDQLFDYQTIEALGHIIPPPEFATIASELIKIWEEVLNFKPIHEEDNFFEIGGDSILSIQIIARARKAGIIMAPTDFFEHQTIAEQVLFLSNKGPKTLNQVLEAPIGKIPLTPIQYWFFEAHKNAPSYWSQGVKINRLPHVSREHFRIVVDSLIRLHSALRLKFYRASDNVWQAEVLANLETKAFEYHDLSSVKTADVKESVGKLIEDTGKSLTIEKGTLFKAIYCHIGSKEENICVFIAHHLVVDAVSWQILLNDFKDQLQAVLNNEEPIGLPAPTGIETVAQKMNELAFSKELLEQETFWREQSFGRKSIPTDHKYHLPLLEEHVQCLEFELEEAHTKRLMTKANLAFNTTSDELLIVALTEVLCSWSKTEHLWFGLERHGRDLFADKTLDMSSTVGWLTAYFPVKLRNHGTGFDEKTKYIKDKLRNIIPKGAQYGLLKYLKRAKVDSIPEYSPEIVFNFLGKQNSASQIAKNSEFITENLRSPKSERNYLFEINTMIQDDVLKVKWEFSLKAHRKETVLELTKKYKTELIALIDFCSNQQNSQYTTSDFPDVQLNQDDLDELLNSLE